MIEAKMNYGDFFGLVIGPSGQSDAQAETGGSVDVAAVQHDDDDLVRRRSRLFQTLIGIFQQLLQLLFTFSSG